MTPLSESDFRAQLVDVLPTEEMSVAQLLSFFRMGVIKKIERLRILNKALIAERSKKTPNAVFLRRDEGEKARLEKDIEVAKVELVAGSYLIYQQVCAAAIPVVLGKSEDLKEDKSIIVNFGVLSEASSGGVFSPSPWTLAKNYAFILGAIHSARTIYVAGKISDSHLWNEKETPARATMLGYELAILYAAGYRQVATCEDMERYGAVFVKVVASSHLSVLKDLIDRAEVVVRSIDAIHGILEPDKGG